MRDTSGSEVQLLLSPDVSLRLEHFGGVAYNYRSRALSLIQDRPTAEVALTLGVPCRKSVVFHRLRELGVEEHNLGKAVDSLLRSGVVTELVEQQSN